MAITYLTASDPIVGANDPRYPDAKNSCGQYINTQMLVEHDADGDHDFDYNLVGEISTYTGNGAARTISLTNSNLTPKLVIIWRDSTLYRPFFHLSNFDATEITATARAFTVGWTTWFTGSADGEFSLDTYTGVNENAVSFFYLVLGIDITTTYTGTPASGSDPTWVDDGEAMQADGTLGSIANRVEGHIETQFLVGHSDAGVHSAHPLAAFGKIDLVSWTGDGLEKVIMLNDTALDIKELVVLNVDQGGGAVSSATESMPSGSGKDEDTSAFDVNRFPVLGTGTFTLEAGANINGRSFYAMAIGV